MGLGRSVGCRITLIAALATGVTLTGCGGGTPGDPAASISPQPSRAAAARRPLPDLRHMRAAHAGGNWGGNVEGFKAPLLSDAPTLSAQTVAIEGNVSTFQDSSGVSHTNDMAIVHLTNVQVGQTSYAKAGFWVYRDATTGATGLQFRPQLDSDLAPIAGFSGDVNISLSDAGVNGIDQASGDALAFVKAVLAHGAELIATPNSLNLSAGATLGQPSILSPLLASKRTQLSSGDADYFAFLKSMNVEWLGVSVALHYDSYSDPTVRTHVCSGSFTDSGGNVNPCTFADADLTGFLARARANGFKVYMTLAFETSANIDTTASPNCHLPSYRMSRWLLGAPELPSWSPASQCIAASDWWWNPAHPQHAANVQAFFASYQQQAVKYAAIAEQAGVDLFSLGTETDNLFRTRAGNGAYTNNFSAQLQAMVAAVRQVYGGALTYDQNSELYYRPNTYGGTSAGGAQLFNDLGLDVVGLSAYFPLASSTPGRVLSTSELDTAWENVFQTYLEPMRQTYPNKPIVFTEVGYIDDVDSPFTPAVHELAPLPAGAVMPTPGMTQQGNIYQSFFVANARHNDLVAGTFWWGNDYFPGGGAGCGVVTFGLYCNAPGKQAVSDGYAAWQRKDADRTFNWAAANYPSLLSGSTTSGTLGGYYYRYHTGTGTYLGLQEATGDVFVHNGREFNFVDLGPLRTYLDIAGRAGY
jgi:hypothetical protein